MEFKLPELGENVENGDVVNVLVSEGDQIEANQPICELETDKAVVEIPCTYAGRVTKVHFKKGDTVKVGQTMVTLDAEDEPSEKPAEKEQAEAKEEKKEPPPEKEEEEEVEVEEEEAKPKAAREEVPLAAPARSPQTAAETPVPAGPAARRLARELDVDLDALRGTGRRGRITTEDVQAAAGAAAAHVAERPAAVGFEPVTPPGEPDRDGWGAVRREKMSKIRRTIAAQMLHSVNTTAQLTNFDDADVTDLEMLRKGVPKDFLGKGVKLTMMPFVLKAAAVALRLHPAMNSSIDDEKEEILYKEYVHLGVAVDTPRGLVVPKIRDADRLGIPAIAKALASVAQKARTVDFSVDDLRGGTFTISNLGAVGGTYSTPIINHPEVAILLVGRSRWMPVVRDDAIHKRFMMPLSLSYDHRLVDGATAGRFLNEVIQLLQSPAVLMWT